MVDSPTLRRSAVAFLLASAMFFPDGVASADGPPSMPATEPASSPATPRAIPESSPATQPAVPASIPTSNPASGPTTEAASQPAHELGLPPESASLPATLGWLAFGFVTGFVAHESGHIVANLMLSNVPHIVFVKVDGFIPFVAIEPRIYCTGDTCVNADGKPFSAGRHGKFEIVSAGFQVQHLTDEILLQLHPDLRDESAPYLKGLLAFNTLVSVMYALAAWTGTEGVDGDVAGQASVSKVPKSVLAGFLMVPAGLDIYRYYVPSSKWAPWASIGAKAGYVGLTFTF